MCRPGGVWRLVMHGPDGTDYKNRIVFLEVVKPERLVYRHEPENGTEPVTFETTVTFAERGGKTEITFRMLFPSAEILEQVVKKYGAIEGAKQTLGRLGEHVDEIGMRAKRDTFIKFGEAAEFLIVRMFDAPRELVFKAWTKPEYLTRWFGPDGCHSAEMRDGISRGRHILRFVVPRLRTRKIIPLTARMSRSLSP